MLKRAKARIVLAIDESLFVHIENETTASNIWKKLENLYEDSGLTRQISLLRKLITFRLSECDSMMDYVKEIFRTANKLASARFPISPEWLGVILLAGLGEEFKSFIMGIESSGISITGEAIKAKLLDYDCKNHGRTCIFPSEENRN